MTHPNFDLSVETISSGNITIEVYRHAAGSIKSLRYKKDGRDYELFRSSEHENVNTINNFDARNTACYPLIPFSNRIGNAGFDYDGRTYEFAANMPPEPHHIHGWAWQNYATIKERSDNNIVIEHIQNSEDYPYRFNAEQDWTIRSDRTLGTSSVTVNLAVQNTGNRQMPFGLGLHPFFTKTPQVEIKASCKKILLAGDDALPNSHSDIPPEMDLSTLRKVRDLTLDHCYTGWDHECTVIWPEYGIEMLIESEQIFSNLVVFVPEGEDFFCAEPVTNITDAHNNPLKIEPTGLTDLAPAQVLSGSIRFQFKTL